MTELLNHDGKFATFGKGMHPFTSVEKIGDFFKKRVRAVAMADSTHSSDLLKGNDKRAWMRNVSNVFKRIHWTILCIDKYSIQHVVNWAVSSEPRGQPITDNRFGCDCLSSGKTGLHYVGFHHPC